MTPPFFLNKVISRSFLSSLQECPRISLHLLSVYRPLLATAPLLPLFPLPRRQPAATGWGPASPWLHCLCDGGGGKRGGGGERRRLQGRGGQAQRTSPAADYGECFQQPRALSMAQSVAIHYSSC